MVLLADSLFVQACIWVTQTFVSILALVSAVMQHRMLREAQKAMTPWMNGQPIYAPISSNASSQGVPILYSGEWKYNKAYLWCFVASNPRLYVRFGFRSGGHNEIKQMWTLLLFLYWTVFNCLVEVQFLQL